jgi:hypothetical protein
VQDFNEWQQLSTTAPNINSGSVKDMLGATYPDVLFDGFPFVGGDN